MKGLRCAKCEIGGSRSDAYFWYGKELEHGEARRKVERWLCPECAGEFRSDGTRDAFLRRTLEK